MAMSREEILNNVRDTLVDALAVEQLEARPPLLDALYQQPLAGQLLREFLRGRGHAFASDAHTRFRQGGIRIKRHLLSRPLKIGPAIYVLNAAHCCVRMRAGSFTCT